MTAKINNAVSDGKDITIVIITYNRYKFLMRLLKFYDNYDHHFQYLILDSSSHELNDEVKNYLGRENVFYKKYDSSIFFAHKIADGCQFIKTSYCVLCAYDDFLIPEGILESRNFLKENADFASAHGLYFNHTSAEDAQKKGFTIGPLYGNISSAESDSSVKRLNSYMSGVTGYYPMYAVHRTGLFQHIWKETNVYVSDWGLSELFPCALSFIYGKMKVLPVFYSSREPNTYTSFNENRNREMYNQEKVKMAIKGLGKHLCTFVNMDKDKSFYIATHALNTYLAYFEKKMANRRGHLTAWFQLRKMIGVRTRFRKLFLNGCHPSIYQKSKSDYIKIMQSVTKSNLKAEELNMSRREYATQAL